MPKRIKPLYPTGVDYRTKGDAWAKNPMHNQINDWKKMGIERVMAASRDYAKFSCAIITIMDDASSIAGARRLLQSIKNTNSHLEPSIIPATTPSTLFKEMSEHGFVRTDWKWPSQPFETKIDMQTGMKMTGYNAKDVDKVIACFMSHYKCWRYCAMTGYTTIIFEHDAVLTRSIKVNKTFDFLNDGGRNLSPASITRGYDIVGLNSPISATRNSGVYLKKVQEEYTKHGYKPGTRNNVISAPWVDTDITVPQGLAGNSAYILTSKGAASLLRKVEEVGIWPNDALMCRQFFPNLKQAYPFYTKVQGTESTTRT